MSFRRRAPLALSLLLSLVPVAASSCGDDEAGKESAAAPSGTVPPDAGPDAPDAADAKDAPKLARGDYSLTADEGALRITLARKDETLLTLTAESLQLGTVDELSDSESYDPYPLVAKLNTAQEPDGLAFHSPTSLAVTKASATSLELSLVYPSGITATLVFVLEDEGRFSAKLTSAGGKVAYHRLAPRVDASEGFYGLGEYYDDVNQRGKIRAMQIETDPQLEHGYNEAHVPIPFVIGTRGWGLFVECPHVGAFDVGNADPEVIEATFGTGKFSGDGIKFHLYAAGHPLDVTRHYHATTGKPRLPGRWALGPWLWRDENDDQTQVEGDLDAMRDKDLPHTAIWIDRPYASAVNTFDFDPAKFSAPQAMIDKMHALGFRTALWHTPYVDEKDPKAAALREEAKSRAFYPKKFGIQLNNWGTLLDLTNPDAYAWWQDHIRLYQAMGIEGYKMDYGEDVVPGLFGARNVWEFFDGSDERTMHSRFQLLYHRVYQETLPADGGFLLCRHSTYGDQTNVNVIWPGDLDATFAKHREKAVDGDKEYTSVGGLPASMIAGLTLGPSGFPFYGADTGGYNHSPPDKELLTRWFEQTALSTVMQIGNSSSTVAWEPHPETGFDEEMVGWYRTYTRLHLRLFPYEWTYAMRLLEDGRPIQRAVGLAYPELGQHPNDEYLFGDHLLVAPVLERGARSRTVLFPPGRWFDVFTGDAHDAGTASVDAPLEKLPLYLHEGGIVPLLRPTIDAMAPTTEPERVDSYATTPGVLYVLAAPGKKSSFTVFDGTLLETERTDTGATLMARGGDEFTLGVQFEMLPLSAAPSVVSEGGAPLASRATLAELETSTDGYFFDPALGGRLHVKVSGGEHRIDVTF
jgi:alpha-D-xyloside xylohydrolase